MFTILRSDMSYLGLTLLLSASVYLLIVGIRIVKSKPVEGVLTLVLSLFCLASHFFILMNLSIIDPFSFATVGLSIWGWSTLLLAPSLIITFIFTGLLNLFKTRLHSGLVKLYFGLTLLCFLYMVGINWSVEIKGMITLVFCFILFDEEFTTAR